MIKGHIVLLFFIFSVVVMPSAAALLTGGPGVADGDPYPYIQMVSDANGSFDVIMDASPDSGSAQLYVSTFTGLGIQKASSGSDNGDYRQINPDEFLEMTITNLNGGAINFIGLSGTGSYFDPGILLYLYKNGALERTIACNGNSSYDIIPPIVAEEGDSIWFNPTGNVRLNSFDVTIDAGFPISNEPYIPDSADTTNLLDTVIASNGHYYVTADWSGLTHKPDGVVVKVGKGNASTQLYYLGATGPTSEIDFDLLILEPGDTVKVLAGLTGDAGEDPGLWGVSLERVDSWSGTRYSVPVVPLGLASPPSGLDLYRDKWPKNAGFRNDYRALRGQDVVFDLVLEALGHAPKCFDEELSYPSANIPILDNYAQTYTNRQALFHWNGKMVKPFLGGTLPAKMGDFKPYHFRYDVGTYLSSAINGTTTQITVDDPGLFTTNANNIAIIIPVDPTTGERSFDDAEMVTVTAISGNQLTVIRNVYQSIFGYTSAGDFSAGSYIAPAVQEFVRVEAGGIRYNHSLLCPVDGQGRTGSDLLAEMLSHEFAVGSHLERFHGIMFDVLPRSVGATEDCNLDGIADGGVDARGVDLYHLGVQGMGRKLRAAIPDRIITFDGQDDHWPALQTVFSGVEAEGFSRYNDSYTTRWSKSLNYYQFAERWNQSSNFYNFCVTKQNDFDALDGTANEVPTSEKRAIRRFHEAGLTAMGVAVNHAAVAISTTGPFYALDEMRKGVENQLQWLGAPTGDLIRPGLSVTDELGGAGLPAVGWSCPDGSATLSNGTEGVVVIPVDTEIDHDMIIEYSGISIPEGDLLIRFEGKGSLEHLPSDTARAINVEVDGRVQNNLTYDILTGVVNNEGFTEVTAYFRSAGPLGGTNVTLRLTIEGATDLTLRNFTVHNATDVLLREFENGIVLCNPSQNPYTFDLSSFFPGQQYKRIQGQVITDGGSVLYDETAVNDGSAVGSTVQLDGYRGLFLVKEHQFVDVVDFDATGVGNTLRTDPTTSDSFSAVWDFSETVPLIHSASGTNTTVYGGIFNTWSVASNYTPWVRFLIDTFQNQNNPDNGSDTTATGMLVWKKEDFLSGAATQTVSLASGGELSCTVLVGVGSRETRLMVKQGGSYYVSEEYLLGNGTLTIDPTVTDWAPVSTVDYSIGTYTSNVFTDVEAVGLHYSISNSGNQSLIRISGFNLAVPESALSALPPEFSMGIGSSGSGNMVIIWITELGTTYRLQGRTNLVEGVWENIGDPVPGTGDSLSITNIPSDHAGFYRIIIE